MEIVCKCLGGSHSYGLNTASSDIDIRGVFINTDTKHILNLEAHEHQKEKNDDTMLYEIRRFVELLRNGNTGALEILFNKNWIEVNERFLQYFTYQATRFIDSQKLHKCLKGYAQHELRLAMGLRPGEIGFKRFESVKQYGFSPKNFTQLFRLMMVGKHFFDTGEFIVDCRQFPDPKLHEFLMSVKTCPEKHTINILRGTFDIYEKEMDVAFENRKHTFKFDNKYACDVLLNFYYPTLAREYNLLNIK